MMWAIGAYHQNAGDSGLCYACYCYANGIPPRNRLLYQTACHDWLIEDGAFDADQKYRYDVTVDGGCSRYRPDWMLDCFTHVLIVECDESHDQYCQEGEVNRIQALAFDVAFRPIILIRFNPKPLFTRKKMSNGGMRLLRTDRFESSMRELADRIRYWKSTVATVSKQENLWFRTPPIDAFEDAVPMAKRSRVA